MVAILQIQVYAIFKCILLNISVMFIHNFFTINFNVAVGHMPIKVWVNIDSGNGLLPEPWGH